MSTDPRTIASTYLSSWRTGDYDTLRTTLAEHVSFHGVLGATDGIDATITRLQGMAGDRMPSRRCGS